MKVKEGLVLWSGPGRGCPESRRRKVSTAHGALWFLLQEQSPWLGGCCSR